MNEKDFVISTILECKDEIDRQINSSTVAMIMVLKVKNLIFYDNSKNHDDYFMKVKNVASSLQKANEHYRKYIIEERRFLDEYRDKCMSIPDANTHSSTTAVSLSTELDGFLSHFKAGLDTLATTLNPLLGLNLNGWHKKDNKSGLLVIRTLERNLGDSLKSGASHLIEYIQKNMDWVTYIVDLRDKVIHHGGLKRITDISFNFRDKNVTPQIIIHPSGSCETVSDFMLRTLNEAIEYFNTILILSLEITVNGMSIIKNKEGELMPYQWAIKIDKLPE